MKSGGKMDEFWKGYLTACIVAILSILFIGSFSHCDSLKTIIELEAMAQGLDPQVAMAIASIESNLNPNALGEAGEVGLFQIRPEFSDPRADLYNPRTNARIGIEKLLYYKRNCPAQEGLTWVHCFNDGLRNPKYPTLLPYYKKFLKALASK